ncbi:2073_t:CDS:2, partial [Gigaspora margarita]
EDLKCKNNIIPAGTVIGIYPYGIHHSPTFWENPNKFIPERFENKNLENLEFYGFGGGSRIVPFVKIRSLIKLETYSHLLENNKLVLKLNAATAVPLVIETINFFK